MASTAEVKLEAGDKATPAAAKKAGGLFHRPHMPHLPSKAKKAGQSTADMHSALDKSRFKNDPRMPQIKQEIAEMDADGDGHLDQEEVATYTHAPSLPTYPRLIDGTRSSRSLAALSPSK